MILNTSIRSALFLRSSKDQYIQPSGVIQLSQMTEHPCELMLHSLMLHSFQQQFVVLLVIVTEFYSAATKLVSSIQDAEVRNFYTNSVR